VLVWPVYKRRGGEGGDVNGSEGEGKEVWGNWIVRKLGIWGAVGWMMPHYSDGGVDMDGVGRRQDVVSFIFFSLCLGSFSWVSLLCCWGVVGEVSGVGIVVWCYGGHFPAPNLVMCSCVGVVFLTDRARCWVWDVGLLVGFLLDGALFFLLGSG